jgi:hypothetical protein
MTGIVGVGTVIEIFVPGMVIEGIVGNVGVSGVG